MFNTNESTVGAPPSQVPQRRVDVVTGSRLHFGLLSAGPVDGVRYGGCGLMLHRPSVWVRAQTSEHFTFRGQLSSRCMEVVSALVRYFDLSEPPPCDLQLVRSPEAHTGLGSGTQINLAVAQALTSALDFSIDLETLAAKIAGRGRRSAVGVHGFAHGGFIAESGVTETQPLGMLQGAVPFPSEWRILLVRPEHQAGEIHGKLEQTHFSQLPDAPKSQREALQNLMNEQILPAVIDRDFAAFCDAVAEFNHASGMMFAAVQGGAYNGPQLESVVAYMRQMGCRGIGQSSWGPTIFAFTEDQASAEKMQSQLRENEGDRQLRIEITRARNKPASVCCP